MGWNGLKFVRRILSWRIEALNNKNISSTDMDSDSDEFAEGISQCITNDPALGGRPQVDMDWNGKRLTGLGAATHLTDAVQLKQVVLGVNYVEAISNPDDNPNQISVWFPEDPINGTKIIVKCFYTNDADFVWPESIFPQGAVVIYNRRVNVKVRVIGMDMSFATLPNGTIVGGSVREFIYSGSYWCLAERTADTASVDLGNVSLLSPQANVANKGLSNVLFNENTTVANKGLSNITFTDNTLVANKDLSNAVISANTPFARKDLSNTAAVNVQGVITDYGFTKFKFLGNDEMFLWAKTERFFSGSNTTKTLEIHGRFYVPISSVGYDIAFTSYLHSGTTKTFKFANANYFFSWSIDTAVPNDSTDRSRLTVCAENKNATGFVFNVGNGSYVARTHVNFHLYGESA